MQSSLGIIFNQSRKQVLLVERRDMPVWVFPGGYVEMGETPEQAVLREVKEETGYQVNILDKIGEYSYSGNDKITHTYICEITGGNVSLSDESKSVDYFNINALPKLTSPYAQKMIKDALSESPKPLAYQFENLPFTVKLKALLHPWAFFKYLLVRLGIHWNT